MGKIPYEIKDWKFWKVSEYPELIKLEKQLAEKGLKNPWLRNEAWKFQSHLQPIGAMKIFTRGIGFGFGAFLIAAGLEHLYSRNNKVDDHH